MKPDNKAGGPWLYALGLIPVAYSEEGFKYYHFVNAESAGAFDGFIAECKALALYETSVSAEYGDQLITLSTCEYSRTNGRMVVVAKLLEK